MDGTINIVKKFMPSKSVHRTNAVLITSLMAFFHINRKKNPAKIHKRCHIVRNFEKKEKRNIIPSDLKTYCKTVVKRPI